MEARVALLLVAALACSTAQGATLYLATDGSNSNGGTSPSDAFQTLSYAVSAASAGDTIAAAAGVYSGAGNSGVTLASVSLVGDDMSTTVFMSSNMTTVTATGSVLISQVSFSGPQSTYGPSGVQVTSLAVQSGTVDVDAVGFYDSSQAMQAGGSELSLSMSGCYFDASAFQGMYLSSCNDFTLKNTFFNVSSLLYSAESPCQFSIADCTFFGAYASLYTASGVDVTVSDTVFRNEGGSTVGYSYLASPLTVEVASGSTFVVDGCSFQNIAVDSAVVAVQGSGMSWANFTDCYFSDNFVVGGEAGIQAHNINVLLSNSTFENNDGIALFHKRSYITEPLYSLVTGCTFGSNYNRPSFAVQLLNVTSEITDCSATGTDLSYGIVGASEGTLVTVRRMTATLNQANYAMFIGEGSELTLSDSTFSGNFGGTVYVKNAIATVTNITVTNSTECFSSGVQADVNSVVTVTDSVFRYNDCCGFMSKDASITMTGSDISYSSVRGAPGGGFLCSGGTVNISDSVIAHNEASGGGDAYSCMDGCYPILEDVLVIDNDPSATCTYSGA